MLISFKATDNTRHIFDSNRLIAISFVECDGGNAVNILLDDNVRLTQHVTKEESDDIYKILMGDNNAKK